MQENFSTVDGVQIGPKINFLLILILNGEKHLEFGAESLPDVMDHDFFNIVGFILVLEIICLKTDRTI